MDTKPEETTEKTAYWTLLRDMFVLQFKLLVDGFRDVLLVPASIIAAIVSLVKTEDGKPGPQFYNVLALGKQSEHWINLFGALENSPDSAGHDKPLAPTDLDDFVARVESYVIDEYKRGGVTKQAKDRIDTALDALQKHNKRSDKT
jgi:hypothetical protein